MGRLKDEKLGRTDNTAKERKKRFPFSVYQRLESLCASRMMTNAMSSQRGKLSERPGPLFGIPYSM